MRPRRGILLPLVLGILMLLEAAALGVGVWVTRARRRGEIARASLAARAALVEAVDVARWNAPLAVCDATAPVAVVADRSLSGVPFTVRWTVEAPSLLWVVVEAGTFVASRRRTTWFQRRSVGCDLTLVPGLPPPF